MGELQYKGTDEGLWRAPKPVHLAESSNPASGQFSTSHFSKVLVSQTTKGQERNKLVSEPAPPEARST